MTPDMYATLRLVLFVAVGFGAGVVLGFVIAAMLVAARQADDDAEALRHWRE